MAALPYIQLYVADYLADTTHLSTVEHGAYLLLIMNYWQRGKALASANDRLARVARLSNEEWDAIRETIAEFFTVTDEEWRHERIERDLEAVRAKSEKASNAGKASAERRRNKRSNDRSTDAERTNNHADAETEHDPPLPPKGESVPSGFNEFWSAYPRKKSKGDALKAWKKLKPDAALIRRILGAVEAAKGSADWLKEDGRFIPHPATWLNSQGWEDELTVAKASSHNGPPSSVPQQATQRTAPEPIQTVALREQIARRKADAGQFPNYYVALQAVNTWTVAQLEQEKQAWTS